MTRGGWLVAVGLGSCTVPLTGQTVHYEGGLSVASGTYIFTQRTTGWTLANGLAINAGPFTIRATLPVYWQNTTLVAGGSTGPLPTGGSSSGAVRDSSAARGGQGRGRGPSMAVADAVVFARAAGDPVDIPSSAVTGFEAALGDPTLHLSAITRGRTSFTVSAGVKVPLADTTSFGTGEWDVGGSVGLSHLVGQSVLVGADLSYWHLGDLPELELTDPITGSVSVAYLSMSGWGGSLALSGSRSVIEGFEDTYSLTGGLTRVRGRGALGVTASIGFTETAPDFSLGLHWRVALSNHD